MADLCITGRHQTELSRAWALAAPDHVTVLPAVRFLMRSNRVFTGFGITVS
jgi:hypothetical protein